MDIAVKNLLNRVSRGDIAALEELYRSLRSAVYCYALVILRDPCAAEDVMQETFVRVFKLANTHRPESDGSAWIFTIAKNLCLDRLRAAGHAWEPLEDSDTLHPDNASELQFITDLELRDALSTLAVETCRVVMLHLAGGFKFREIASLLRIKQSAVQWQYYSALKELAAYYEAKPVKGSATEGSVSE